MISGVSITYFRWSDQSSLHRNISYALCDGRAKKITVDRIGDSFRLTVNDRFAAVSSVVIQKEHPGGLLVGGKDLLSN